MIFQFPEVSGFIYLYIAFKRRSGYLPISHVPSLPLRVPSAPGSLRLRSRSHVISSDAQRYNRFI